MAANMNVNGLATAPSARQLLSKSRNLPWSGRRAQRPFSANAPASSSRPAYPMHHGSRSDPFAAHAWRDPGPAAFDFRSDVVTRPTARMLEAIAQTSLLDDDFAEDPETNALQNRVAELTAHEAGLLVTSGTMGNQVAIRSHLTQPPYAILCDHRAHILTTEGGGASTWTGATIQAVTPRNGRYLTLEDVERLAVLDDGDNFYACPTRLISLENTLHGSIMPLSETRKICEWARHRGIKAHLDGARLWDAAVSGTEGSVTDFARLFDSVSVCFSKSLGAPIGSMLVGSRALIKKARWCRKAMGGGTRQAGVIAAAARVALEDTFGSAPDGQTGKLLRQSHENAHRIAAMWTSRGGRLADPTTETNMVWLDLDAAGISAPDWVELGRREGLKLMGNRLVVHYQIGDEAIQKLERVMDAALAGRRAAGLAG